MPWCVLSLHEVIASGTVRLWKRNSVRHATKRRTSPPFVCVIVTVSAVGNHILTPASLVIARHANIRNEPPLTARIVTHNGHMANVDGKIQPIERGARHITLKKEVRSRLDTGKQKNDRLRFVDIWQQRRDNYIYTTSGGDTPKNGRFKLKHRPIL